VRRALDLAGSAASLPHPEWLTPEPMTPRRRMQRFVEGRAAAVQERYDTELA
jgi:hypothetical protein